MTAQVQIPDLNPAGPIDPNDLMLVRQGIMDVKATVAQISQINFATYTISSSPLSSTDVLLLGRNDGSGGYQNYAINPQQLGFLPGARTWFYTNVAPLGWSIVPNTGDRVLGTVGGVQAYSSTGLHGNWQQDDVGGIPGNGLTIEQIPNHQHWGQFGREQTKSKATYLRGTEKLPDSGNPRYTNNAILGIVGGYGDPGSHDVFGQCLPHSHGNTWRPAGVIGIICQKS